MIAFEVQLNGKKLCTAGMKEFGNLCVHLDWSHGPHVAPSTGFQHSSELLELLVAGISVHSKRRKAPCLKEGYAYTHELEWVRRRLRPGDELMLKVIEIGSADRPRKRKRIRLPAPVVY